MSSNTNVRSSHVNDLHGDLRRTPFNDKGVCLGVVTLVEPEPTASEHTECGEDISALIIGFEEPDAMSSSSCYHADASAEVASSHGPPRSASFSTVSLGKRKLSDLSESSASSSDGPTKLSKHVSAEKHSSIAPATQLDVGGLNEPYIIAHSPAIQQIIATSELAYGVQYEIARLITLDRVRYGDISGVKLNLLRGSNAQSAPETARTLIGTASDSQASQDLLFADEVAFRDPWEQLDIEETALSKDEYAGLGHSKNYLGWYGGKIEFRGKIQKAGKSYQVVLERCSLGPSCQFARRFGSKNFLRIKIPLDILHSTNNGLNSYFCRPFVLWDRVFRSFYAKDDVVLLFRTNELMKNGLVVDGHWGGMSFLQFIDWHNPLEANSHQTMSKWSARFALGLSNSYPGPIIAPGNIGHENDIISLEGSDMTDGCGFSNRNVHVQLYHSLKCETFPMAIQFRLAGNKGMLLQRVDSSLVDDIPKVWLRPSQTKIRYLPGRPLDPAHLIIDVLRTSHLKSPARVSAETIINLAENGVPCQVFVDLLSASILEIIQGLTTWDGPDAMLNLWANVEHAGGVLAMRRAREAAGEARVRGLGHRAPDNADDGEDDDEEGLNHFDRALNQRSSAWWADQISGCPSTLEETVLVLLDAGFTPQKCSILREKLRQVVSTRIRHKTQNFRYEVQQSASAVVVPDPFQVLGPDEIQVKSSRRNLKSVDGLDTDTIVGDTLLTRNPCKLPTDVRKVKAVEHPLLRELVDVIVCSVQGHRRLLDFLAGGDYDGDTAIAIWAPAMVEPFKNANNKYSVEPDGLGACFSSNNESVSSFIQRAESMPPASKISAMQHFLLGALRDTSLVGMYSAMHDNAIYELGYAHPRTIRLGYKFCKVLDGAKTGLKILPQTLHEDLKRYHHPRGPEWKSVRGDKAKSTIYDTTNAQYLKRKPSGFVKSKFVMDVLHSAAIVERNRALVDVERIFSPINDECDKDLTKPWLDAVSMSERGSPESIKRKRKDLATIALHVQAMYSEHKTSLKGTSRGTSFTSLTIEVRQDVLRALSKKFHSGPRLDELDSIMDETTLARLRASYAYMYDSERNTTAEAYGWSRFPWNMAMRDLCTIKASALGAYKTTTNEFYIRFRLPRVRT